MQTLIVDMEGDNLLVGIKNIWCIVAKVYQEKEYLIWTKRDNQTLESFLESLKPHRLVFHHGLGFDIPAIQKFVPKFDPKNVEDTFVLSSLFEPDRVGGHSLEQYGEEFGYPKIQHEDWSQFSEEMLQRCIRDTEITEKVWDHLLIERASWNWEKAIQLEYAVAKLCAQMSLNGIVLDVELARKTLEAINKELEEIDERLLMELPLRCVGNKTVVSKPFLKSGELSKQVKDYFGGNCIPYI